MSNVFKIFAIKGLFYISFLSVFSSYEIICMIIISNVYLYIDWNRNLVQYPGYNLKTI